MSNVEVAILILVSRSIRSPFLIKGRSQPHAAAMSTLLRLSGCLVSLLSYILI